jgi:hypothetical protein
MCPAPTSVCQRQIACYELSCRRFNSLSNYPKSAATQQGEPDPPVRTNASLYVATAPPRRPMGPSLSVMTSSENRHGALERSVGLEEFTQT